MKLTYEELEAENKALKKKWLLETDMTLPQGFWGRACARLGTKLEAANKCVDSCRDIESKLRVNFDDNMKPFYDVAYQYHFSKSIIEMKKNLQEYDALYKYKEVSE